MNGMKYFIFVFGFQCASVLGDNEGKTEKLPEKDDRGKRNTLFDLNGNNHETYDEGDNDRGTLEYALTQMRNRNHRYDHRNHGVRQENNNYQRELDQGRSLDQEILNDEDDQGDQNEQNEQNDQNNDQYAYRYAGVHGDILHGSRDEHDDKEDPRTIVLEKPVPYPIKVPVPVDKPYPVAVPSPYPVSVEKFMPYEVSVNVPQPLTVYKPVPFPVPVPVPRPYEVSVPKPYPVYLQKLVPYNVIKPIPYPVHVTVDKPYPVRGPIKKHYVPYPVVKRVPYKVPVEVKRPYPVTIEKPVPYLVDKSGLYNEGGVGKMPFKIDVPVHAQYSVSSTQTERPFSYSQDEDVITGSMNFAFPQSSSYEVSTARQERSFQINEKSKRSNQHQSDIITYNNIFNNIY